MANFRGELIPVLRFTYTGADGEVIPEEATHILVQARKVRFHAFRFHYNIVEVICHEIVEEVEYWAFYNCYSLRRVIMPNVKIVGGSAFYDCADLEDVECDKLEIIEDEAFSGFELLRSINLPSARIVCRMALGFCEALTDVKFGNRLEEIEEISFCNCKSLERITIPLKDGLFSDDNIFQACESLRQVDLIEGEVHETIAALHFEEWRNDMNEEIDSINQILPHVSAGEVWGEDVDSDEMDPGEKARTIRRWIRSVLDKIILYQAEHRRLLEEDVVTILEHLIPNDDIKRNNVLPFLELPSYTFERDDEEI